MATSNSCRWSFNMMKMNYKIDTPIEFLSQSLNFTCLSNLTRVFSHFFSLKNWWFSCPYTSKRAPFYNYKETPPKKEKNYTFPFSCDIWRRGAQPWHHDAEPQVSIPKSTLSSATTSKNWCRGIEFLCSALNSSLLVPRRCVSALKGYFYKLVSTTRDYWGSIFILRTYLIFLNSFKIH